MTIRPNNENFKRIMGGGFVLSSENEPSLSSNLIHPPKWSFQWKNSPKRAFDIVVASLMIVLFLPLFVFCSLRIMVATRSLSTVFFSHKRIGRHGAEFGCLKLQTMRPDAEKTLHRILENSPDLRQEWEEFGKLSEDPRILPGIGHFLRKSSLDELPQLWNVIRGDMSIIGPRPVTRGELHHYGSLLTHYKSVRPGLTGPWQIGGRSEVSFGERVALDVGYARSVSMSNDLRIFKQTVASFLTGKLSGAS